MAILPAAAAPAAPDSGTALRRPDRRVVLKSLAGVAMAGVPLAALNGCVWGAHHLEQSIRSARIGFLSGIPPTGPTDPAVYLREGLRELGYREGQNLVVEYRYGDGRTEDLARLAAELVALPVELIVLGDTRAIRPAMRATSTVPLVMMLANDPVRGGIVKSLTRPGGNITGMSTLVTRDDLDRAFKEAARGLADLLIVHPDSFFVPRIQRIVDFAAAQSLPAMYGDRRYVEAGGLMTYGPDRPALYRRAAFYVSQILKGAKPADLPVGQPNTFEFLINLRTADALGLKIPDYLQGEATELVW